MPPFAKRNSLPGLLVMCMSYPTMSSGATALPQHSSYTNPLNKNISNENILWNTHT